MKKFAAPKLAPSLIALAACLSPLSVTTAHAGDVSVSTGVDVVTDYVFRGVSLADTAIQPFAEATKGNFTVGAWVSTAIGDTSIAAGDELDLYAAYGFELSDKISASVGVTYYHYPQGGSLFSTKDGASGTYEASVSVGFDTVLEPSLSAYYDVTLESFTLEGGVGHSVGMSDKTSLDLGATVGLVDGDGFSYEYAGASAAVSYALSDNTSAYVGGNLALSSEDSLDYKKLLTTGGKGSLVWFGAGISAGF